MAKKESLYQWDRKTFVKTEKILVEVKAASLNPIDYKLVEGKLKDTWLCFTLGLHKFNEGDEKVQV
jgi:NADPH:quinone reductase-like Zn-dependent oxidoreductase